MMSPIKVSEEENQNSLQIRAHQEVLERKGRPQF